MCDERIRSVPVALKKHVVAKNYACALIHTPLPTSRRAHVHAKTQNAAGDSLAKRMKHIGVRAGIDDGESRIRRRLYERAGRAVVAPHPAVHSAVDAVDDWSHVRPRDIHQTLPRGEVVGIDERFLCRVRALPVY